MSLYLLLCDNLALFFGAIQILLETVRGGAMYKKFYTFFPCLKFKILSHSKLWYKICDEAKKVTEGRWGSEKCQKMSGIIWMASYIVITWIYHLEQIKSVTSKLILLFVKEFQIFLMTDESKLSPIIAMILHKVHHFYHHLY